MTQAIALPLLAGAALALALVRWARRRQARAEKRAYAIGLLVAALIYGVFATVRGAPIRWLAVEWFGVLGFGAIAILGFHRSAALLAAGWTMHVLWDVLLHTGSAPGAFYTPAWYPWLCVSFDLVVAGVLLWPASAETKATLQ